MIATRPTLLVNEIKCRDHIDRMMKKALQSGITFRPHFKTHQSQTIGRWYREAGVSKITTSSLQMAEYFVNDGWDDITVAFPLNFLEHKLINSLANKISLNLCSDSVKSLIKLSERLSNSVSVFIEIDTGYGRTGIKPSDHDNIDAMIGFIKGEKKLSFAGFLSHAGHSYKCRSKEAIVAIHDSTTRQVNELTKKYRELYPDLINSVGDTPTCSVVGHFDGVNEIRPGNFIFYDVTQSIIGSCSPDDIAVCVACPVVAEYPDKNEMVIHGGAVHLSKDTVITGEGKQIFGRLAVITTSGWDILPETYFVKGVSQEHGILSVPDEAFRKFKIGDVIGVLPVHSCLTADCLASYTTLSGKELDHFKKAK